MTDTTTDRPLASVLLIAYRQRETVGDALRSVDAGVATLDLRAR